MKYITLSGFLIIVSITAATLFANGCLGTIGSGKIVTQHLALKDFTTVSASGAVEVIISASSDYSVDLEADDNILPYVTTTVSDGTLKIGMKDHFQYSDGTVRLKISMPKLEALKLSGASNGKVESVNTNALAVKIAGASNLVVTGTTDKLTGEVSGASSLDAKKLLAGNVTIECHGASHSHVYASSRISAEATGASSVTYAGNPKEVSRDASGASDISGE